MSNSSPDELVFNLSTLQAMAATTAAGFNPFDQTGGVHPAILMKGGVQLLQPQTTPNGHNQLISPTSSTTSSATPTPSQQSTPSPRQPSPAAATTPPAHPLNTRDGFAALIQAKKDMEAKRAAATLALASPTSSQSGKRKIGPKKATSLTNITTNFLAPNTSANNGALQPPSSARAAVTPIPISPPHTPTTPSHWTATPPLHTSLPTSQTYDITVPGGPVRSRVMALPPPDAMTGKVSPPHDLTVVTSVVNHGLIDKELQAIEADAKNNSSNELYRAISPSEEALQAAEKILQDFFGGGDETSMDDATSRKNFINTWKDVELSLQQKKMKDRQSKDEVRSVLKDLCTSRKTTRTSRASREKDAVAPSATGAPTQPPAPKFEGVHMSFRDSDETVPEGEEDEYEDEEGCDAVMVLWDPDDPMYQIEGQSTAATARAILAGSSISPSKQPPSRPYPPIDIEATPLHLLDSDNEDELQVGIQRHHQPQPPSPIPVEDQSFERNTTPPALEPTPTSSLSIPSIDSGTSASSSTIPTPLTRPLTASFVSTATAAVLASVLTPSPATSQTTPTNVPSPSPVNVPTVRASPTLQIISSPSAATASVASTATIMQHTSPMAAATATASFTPILSPASTTNTTRTHHSVRSMSPLTAAAAIAHVRSPPSAHSAYAAATGATFAATKVSGISNPAVKTPIVQQPLPTISSRPNSPQTVAPTPTANTNLPPKLSAKAYALIHGKTLRQQRPLDLVSMLRTNIGYRFLLIQCYREYSEENVLAFKCIESYHKHPSLPLLQSFIDKYIKKGADLMINISGETRKKITDFVDAYVDRENKKRAGVALPVDAPILDLSTVLQPALKEIVSLLERDSFKRFRQGLLYVAYVSGAQPPTILKRGGDVDQQEDMALIASVSNTYGQQAKAHLSGSASNKKK